MSTIRMNDYTVLMRLLTRTGNPIGAGMEDMLDALGLPEPEGRKVVFDGLAGLCRRLAPLGLTIKHNSLDHVFYVDTLGGLDSEIENLPLPDRLAATLLVIITLAYQEGGWVSLSMVKKMRKKSLQGVQRDLRELESRGYAEYDVSGKAVRPGRRVAFDIDYEEFFRKLSTHSGK